MIGTLGAGSVSSIGRWKCLMATNIITIISSILSLFYSNVILLCAGRFLYGLAIGGYTVFSAKYVIECAPKEISGPTGALL